MSGAHDSPVGHTGVLVVGTRGPDGPGEVEIRIRGGSETFLARSEEPIPAGTDVVILSETGSRTVLVYPIAADDAGDPADTSDHGVDDTEPTTPEPSDDRADTSLDLSEGD